MIVEKLTASQEEALLAGFEMGGAWFTKKSPMGGAKRRMCITLAERGLVQNKPPFPLTLEGLKRVRDIMISRSFERDKIAAVRGRIDEWKDEEPAPRVLSGLISGGEDVVFQIVNVHVPDLDKAPLTPTSRKLPVAEGVEAYPLDAHIWRRDSTGEWVLEISGTIDDHNFICRHTEPLTTPPADVAGLPSLYARVPDTAHIEPMPPTVDRRPLDEEDPALDGYLESDRDWAMNNAEAVTWLIDNHAALRALLAGGSGK